MYDYRQENSVGKVPGNVDIDLAEEVEAWKSRAEKLAAWVVERMVVRRDAFGKYYVSGSGEYRRCKEDGMVDQSRVISHFAGNDFEKIIGLFSTSVEDTCLWLAIDFDRHEGDPEEVAEAVLRFSLHVYQQLETIGFDPLLIDSNGRGGRHLLVLFDRMVAAREVRAFGLWLVREWERFTMPHIPEVFPKQDSINGKYGNFLRLFGLHHSRRYWSKIWHGNQWLAGHPAIDSILSRQGDSPSLIPMEARSAGSTTEIVRGDGRQRSPSEQNQWWAQYRTNLQTLDVVSLFESEGYQVRHIDGRKLEVRCPWSDEHTTGGETAGLMMPDEDEGQFPAFHCFHHHCRGRGLNDVLALFGKDAVERHCRQRDEAERVIIDPKCPLATAEQFVKVRFGHNDFRTLMHHRGQWYLWDGHRYVETTEDDLRSCTWKWLGTCSHRPKDEILPYAPTRAVVASVLDALKAVVNLTGTFSSPCWIDDDRQGEDVVSFCNGLLEVEPYLVIGEPYLLPHTPAWFSLNCLPHQFDPKAECPRWLAFLDQVFEGDQERIDVLAQWFGYCLTGDTRQQKFAMLIGPPRSGKGTTMEVLTAILGSHNVANPSLTSLGSRFGLESLVGKQAAIIGDGHLGRQSDAVAILERLKSIVGGDGQNIDRKGRPEMTNVTIHARFTISVNELPRLPDASAALRSRLLLIPYNRSFEGNEDIGLQERLLDEIPGITNWALEGLRQLRLRGRLIQPVSGQEILEDFVRYSSPVQAFLQDCCQTGTDQEVAALELQQAWRLWCQENGHEAGSMTTLGTRLRAAAPTISRSRHRRDGKQSYYYQGLSLNSELVSRINSLGM